MATSGSTDYVLTRNTLITEALQQLGVLAEGETASSNQLTDCAVTLNLLCKYLATKGYSIWALKHGVLFPNQNQSSYVTGTDRICAYSDFIKTNVNGAHSSSDTTILVDSITGMAASDIVGIQLTDGTFHWTTISGAPSSLTITLASAITDDVDDNALVYTFTTKIDRPLLVKMAWTRNEVSDEDTPMSLVSQDEYYGYPSKTSESSRAHALYYQPGVSTGTVHLWPTHTDESQTVHFIYQRPFEDFDAASDNPDFPPEQQLALTFQLAKALLPKFGAGQETTQKIMLLAGEFDAHSTGFDKEMGGSIFIYPQRW